MKNKLLFYRNTILSYMFKIFKIENDIFYFCSYHGQYSDSPRMLSEALRVKYPQARYIWEISTKSKEIIPNYIIEVKPHSIKSVWFRSRSIIIVDNYLGWNYGSQIKNGLKYKFLSKLTRHQFNLSTWHGTPYKKIGIDQTGFANSRKYFYSSSNLVCCGNNHLKSVLKRITDNNISIIMSGTPRNDRFFSVNKVDIESLYRKLKIPSEKKVLLFAPTFREVDVEMSGLIQINQLDIVELLNEFESRFGGEWIFLYRVHDSLINEIEIPSDYLSNGIVFSGNYGDDMSDYLQISDALITDYSGTFFDFILTKKPCFLYCPDYDSYIKNERELYFSIDELPFSHSGSAEDLYKNIKTFSEKKYSENVDKFLEEIGSCEKGSSTEILTKILISQIEDSQNDYLFQKYLGRSDSE